MVFATQLVQKDVLDLRDVIAREKNRPAIVRSGQMYIKNGAAVVVNGPPPRRSPTKVVELRPINTPLKKKANEKVSGFELEYTW